MFVFFGLLSGLPIVLFLVSLPGMIANSTLDPESVGLVRDYVNELLLYAASAHCSMPDKLIPL